MLLAIDVGNTNIVYGVFDGKNLILSLRMKTDKQKSGDEYGISFLNSLKFNNIDSKNIKGIIISSVVPSLMHSLEAMTKRYFGLESIIVDNNLKMNIDIAYENPSELGADRIANAVACVEKYEGPLIVIDIGTAMTFCYIDKSKTYRGGLIFPGIGISSEALFARASKLPSFEIVEAKRVVEKNTIASMQAGFYFGYVSLIDGIIDKIVEEKDLDRVTLVGTGGFAPFLLKNAKHKFIIDQDLTLEGLRILYDLNM